MSNYGNGKGKLSDENDILYGVKHVGNKPRVSTTPYYVDIVEGNVPDHKSVFKFGNNDDVGTSEESIWAEGGIYPWADIDAAAGQVTVSSSSSQDTNTTGTGAWTCTIYGISSVDGSDQNETITLNGQTAVTSTLSYSRVFRIIVNTAGTGMANDGIIYVGTGTVTSGKPAVVWALVSDGRNQTLQAIWSVPIGKTFYMTSCEFSISGTKGAEGLIYVRPPGELFQIKYLTHLAGGVDYREFNFPLKFESGTDIDVRAIGEVGGTAVGATFSGWYE